MSDPTPVLTGEEIAARRNALGWSRTKLGDAVGLKMTQIERAEKKAPKPEEAAVLAELFERLASQPSTNGNGRPRADDDDDPAVVQARLQARYREGKVVTRHWRGLDPGDIVRIKGEGEEQFRFGHHVAVPAQEYVTLFVANGGGERSIPIDRVLTAGGKALPGELEP